MKTGFIAHIILKINNCRGIINLSWKQNYKILEDNKGNIAMTLGLGKDLVQTQNKHLNENMTNSTTVILRTSVLKNTSRMKKPWSARDFCHTY